MKLGATELSRTFIGRGALPDCPIVDVHAHPLPFGGGYLPANGADAFAASLERNGVALCLIASHTALFSPEEHVRQDVAIVRKYPERIRAWYSFNPRYDSPERAMALFREHPGVFAGFKLHPDMHGVQLHDESYAALLAWCEETGLPVLSHTWGGSPNDGEGPVREIMHRHPRLLFFAGHSLWDNWHGACELANEFPNFHLELTAAGAIRPSLETFVREAGSKKILFGTDLPWFATMHGVGCLLSADISDEDRRNILWRNAVRALGSFGWFREGFAGRLPADAL